MKWPWGSVPSVDAPAPPADPPVGAAQVNGSVAAPPAAPATAPAFIGRAAEQQLFLGLLGEVSLGRSAFVHVTGTARSGRRALLEQFRSLAAARTGARCSPVIDLEDDAGLDLDELLDRIAAGLEPEPEHFKRYFEASKRFHSREAGAPTIASQALAVVRAGSSAVSQLAGVLPVGLPVKVVNAAIQGPIGDVFTQHAETRRTLSAVSEEFVTGLLELAKASGPVALVFSNLDFAPSNAKLLWLRRSLFPRIARAPVILAVSTEPRFELDDVGPLFAQMEAMRLDRFSAAEAEQFLELHIGLPKGSPLALAVLEDSDRFPERLAGYAQYFREHPEARDTDRLPMEARDLTAGGLVSGLLSRVPDPFMRDVLLHAAPLRWFNAELLNGIADACELGGRPGRRPAAVKAPKRRRAAGKGGDGAPVAAPPAGGAGPAAAQGEEGGAAVEGRVARKPGGGRDRPNAAKLLEIGMRPSWVTNVGSGWGIDVETRRRAIVDEFRRLHPGLYRRVHVHAAAYHVTRMRELEGPKPAGGEAQPVGEAFVFDYRPVTHPTDRLHWDEYLASLAEWLYHLVALSPKRGFVRLADHVGEALAWGYPAAAGALLDIGVEITLPGSEALTRQRLLEVARAQQNDRHAETLQLLAEFAAGGSASTIADAAACFLVGTRLVLLGRSPLTVHENFERAETLLAGADDGVQGRSLRCLNLTRLAREKARRDRTGDAALALLTQAAELARSLDPRMQAEIKRTRGLILAASGRTDEARAACDQALELLGRAGAAAEAALVLCLRADVNLRSGGRDAARRDLVSARSIYRQLVDPAAEAQVLIVLLDIALRENDDDGAAEQEAAIGLLRPDDSLLRNQIGNVYFQAGRHEQAVDRYTEGLAIAGEAAVFANRGRARLKWASQLEAAGPPPTGSQLGGDPTRAEHLRRAALEDLAAAFELDHDDLDTGIELAELQRRLGDGTAALATAEIVAGRALDAARALFPLASHPGAGATAADAVVRTALAGRLRDLLVRALTLQGPAAVVEVLEAWTAILPGDEELELMRAIAGQELSAADGSALPAAIQAAKRAATIGQPPRGRALVELAALHAQARDWRAAKQAAETAVQDEAVRVQAEYMLDRLDQMHRREDEFGGEPEALVEELVVDIAEDLRRWFDPQSPVGGAFFGWMIEAFRRSRQERTGLPAPGLWVGVRKEAPTGTLQVVVDNTVRARARVEGDLLADASPEECAARAGVEGRAGSRPWDAGPATWLPASAAEALEAAAIAFWDPRGLVLAALDQALEVTPRFVSAEEAASLSGEAWGELSPGEFMARAGVVRELLAARVPPRELPAVLDAHRAAEPEQRAQVIAAAAARHGVPRATPQELAAAFERTRFKPAPAAAGPGGQPLVAVTIRIAAPGPQERVEQAARRVIAELCGVLYLPEPAVHVEHDPALAEREVAVSVGGVTRLVARPASDLDWWRCHPVAGRAGRTRVQSAGLARTVARALEAVLWDDPAVLLSDAATAKPALTALLGVAPSERLVTTLLEVLGRRVPLGPQSKLKRACEHVLDRSHSGLLRLPAARTFVSSPRRPVPDNLPFGIRDTIHVDERGRLRQFVLRVQLHHDTDSDLLVSLTSPAGRTVVLHELGDDLGMLRTGVDQERLPALAPLLNEHAEGDWTLHVQDVASSDAGLLEEWAIELTTVSSHPGQPAPSATPAIALSYSEREALARSAGLERDLRTRRIEAECGAALWSALEADAPGGRLQEERVRLGTHLARELGLRFGHSIHFSRAAKLPDHDFRILVNGLVRASGKLSPGRYGQVAEGSAAARGDVWVGPLSGTTHRMLPDEVPGGFDAPDRLMRHVRATVREAAPEFADADWATAFLDRLGHTYHVTVAAVRAAAGDDLLAAVLRELVTQGIPVADPRLMELVRELVRSPELARECEALAAAPPTHLGRTAGAMAEWLRERVEHGDREPGVPLLELGPTIEAAVRAAVGSCDARVPVYALRSAGPILRRLEGARIDLGAAKIGVVTAASLRRHVRRLTAAQFPTAEVIAREELDPALARQTIDLPPAELGITAGS